MLHAFLTAGFLLDGIQPAADVPTSSSLLDLQVTETTNFIPSPDIPDLPLPSSSDAALSDQLFCYSDPMTWNSKDIATESDFIPIERLSVSDASALVTSNGVDNSNPSAACANHLVSDDADADLLSQVEDALTHYVGGSSEAV